MDSENSCAQHATEPVDEVKQKRAQNLLAMPALVKHNTPSEGRSFALRLIRQLAWRSPVSLECGLPPGSKHRGYETRVAGAEETSQLGARRGATRARSQRTRENPLENCIATRRLLRLCHRPLRISARRPFMRLWLDPPTDARVAATGAVSR